MSSRNVDVAIRYLIDVTQKGVAQAVALTRDLGVASKATQAQVETSAKAVQAQYSALAKVAAQADSAVAKSAIDSSTVVNKALDSQIAKLRDTGVSYTAIIAKQKELGVSAGALAAAVKRSSSEQIAAMQAVRAEADRPTIRQRVGAAGSRAAGFAGSVASTAGAGALGALGVGGILAYTGLEKSRGVIEGTLAIAGATHLSQQQSLALSTIGGALGIAPRSIGQGIGTLESQVTKALAGGKAAGAQFQTLGITRAQLAAGVNDPLSIFDLVTQRAAKLPATAGAAAQRALLGRGSTIVGQLTAAGPLVGEVAKVQALIPGLDPKKLKEMNEAFVNLKIVTTAFELSFAQAFGPAIGKALNAITPLLPKVAGGFKDAFGFIKGIVDGPVGQALGKFGAMAYDAGKKLVDAFKPAQPFFSNVILPLVKGLAIGIGVGLIGAINGVTFVVKLLAPVFGALGDVLAPLKGLVQGVGEVLGIFFGGGVLGKIAEGLSAVVGEVPLVGKAFEFLVKPVEIVGEGIGKLYEIVAGTFAKIFGFIPGVGSKLASLLGGVAATVVGAFSAVPGAIGSVFSGLGDIIGQAFTGAVNVVIDVVNTAIDGINAVSGAIPFGLGPAQISHVAKVGVTTAPPPSTTKHGTFAHGGLVPAMLSPGEQMIYGGMSAMVPGARTAADNVLAFVPPGTAIMTGHGQALMGAGASLDEALAMQLPHFAPGGKVGTSGYLGFSFKAGAGAKATPRYLHHQLVGNFTQAGWQAYQLAHPTHSATKGFSFAGPASTFGPPGEAAGVTAYGGSSSQPGVALNPHGGSNWNDALANSLAGKAFRIDGAGHSAVLKVIDKGPSAIGRRGPRLIDITGAGVTAMGLNPATFSTDSTFTATQVVGGAASAVTAAQVAKQTPTLANAIASLTGQTAFAGGFQAGLSGQTLIDTLRSGVLSSLISDVAVSSSGLIGGLNIASNQQADALSGGSASRMQQTASLIAARRYNYEWGGGHNPAFAATHGDGHGSGPGVGYDCSGAVSAVLHAGGALRAPLVAQQFMGWGQKGRGKQVSVFSSPTHTFMQLGGRYFGTSLANAGGGAGWLPGFPESMPAVTHPPGLRTGGIVGKGVAFTPTSRPRVDPAAQPLRGVSALLSQSDATDVSGLIGLLAHELDDVQTQTVQSLQALAATLARHSVRGLDAIQQRRLTTVLNLVDAAIGNRVGLSVLGAQSAVDAITRGNAHKIAVSTLAGIDASSTAGLRQAVQLDQAVVQGLNAQVGTLNQALATAKKYGDKATIKTVTDSLNTALGNLDQASVQALSDWKAAIEHATQDTVDSATQAVALAQGGEGILSLQQQLAGTDQTAAGGAQTAAYINGTVIPAFRAQLAAQQQDEAAARSVGDSARVAADQLAEQQTTNSLLTEALTAQKATAQNTQPLARFGGDLALQFNGQTFTDRLAGFGAGT